MKKNILQQKAKQIRLMIFDVDGVLTDGKLFYGPKGEELKVFYVQDGLGLKLLQQSGIEVAIISSRKNQATAQRFRELKIQHVYLGHENKNTAFKKLLTKLKLKPQQVAYAGDDLQDLIVMQQVGLSIAVSNAHPQVKKQADWHTKNSGGNGAAREICDMLLQAQSKLEV
jgi:3-deoxy-D-manno-octulosonate 8-phosphate phosphatase (KDO 8-P phosphatase)